MGLKIKYNIITSHHFGICAIVFIILCTCAFGLPTNESTETNSKREQAINTIIAEKHETLEPSVPHPQNGQSLEDESTHDFWYFPPMVKISDILKANPLTESLLNMSENTSKILNQTLTHYGFPIMTPSQLATYISSGQASGNALISKFDELLKVENIKATLDRTGGTIEDLSKHIGASEEFKKYLQLKYGNFSSDTTKLAEQIVININKEGGGVRGLIKLLSHYPGQSVGVIIHLLAESSGSKELVQAVDELRKIIEPATNIGGVLNKQNPS